MAYRSQRSVLSEWCTVEGISGVGDGLSVKSGVGLGCGLGVEIGVGLGVGLGDRVDVGLGSGLGVEMGVGFGVELGDGLGVGLGSRLPQSQTEPGDGWGLSTKSMAWSVSKPAEHLSKECPRGTVEQAGFKTDVSFP
jgi:hypothetical protein